jgi:hypothetical protein
MDHLVCTDESTGELKGLIRGTRTMIVRGVGEREAPYGTVDSGDTLFFTSGGTPPSVCAKAVVARVVSSGWLTEKRAAAHLARYQHQLRLTKNEIKRWSKSRYLVLIAVDSVARITPFTLDGVGYGCEDDWLLIGDIEEAKVAAVPPGPSQERAHPDTSPALGE